MKKKYEKAGFKIVFMGTPGFAVESLKALHTGGFNIVAVVTAPDKPAGRGQQLQQSEVKQYAIENGLKVLQPVKLKDIGFINELKKLGAHLNIVVAFRMLPVEVWSMPPLGSVNLHGSLLPQYRGAAPINWAVINGETKTGVTTFFLKHEIDTGDILGSAEINIEPFDNAGLIHDKLMVIGAKLLVNTVNNIIDGNFTETPQNQIAVTEIKHAPKIFKNDCKINWQNDGYKIVNLIRGLSPYPAAWCNINLPNGTISTVKIFDAEFIPGTTDSKNGLIVTPSKSELLVIVNNGYIKINQLQLAGKKCVKTHEFLNGFKNSGSLFMN